MQETEESLDKVFAVNVKGTYFACRAVIPAMVAQKKGSIITVASIAGLRSLAKQNAFSYGITKAAVIHFTTLLASEYADQGIRCNCISLGMMDTPMVRLGFGDMAEKICALRDAGSPTGKQGTPWDTANAATFLASDESVYVNGLNLVLDAGFTNAAPNIYPKF
jgi:NAD(P)-dependent dehydrogenase (short-subunit alcohol dehydrogenase family)